MGAITVGQVEALFRLRDEMSAQLKGIQGETKKTGDAFSGLGGASFVFNNITAAVGTVFGAIRSAGGAMADWVRGLMDAGGALTDLSSQTGTSVEFLQKLQYGLEQNGSSLEEGTRAIGLMQKALVAGDADFAKLGLRVSELRAMKPEDAFMATANAIAAIKNPTEQAAAAMAIFGKSGAALLPAMKNDLAGVMKQAEELGFVMSKRTAAAADQLGDSVHTLGKVWDGLKNNVAAVIVENASLHAFIEKGIEVLGRWSKAINGNKAEFGDLVSNGVILFANALVKLVDVLIIANDGLTGLGEAVMGVGVMYLKAAEAAIKYSIAVGYLVGRDDEIMNQYDQHLNMVQGAIAGIAKASQESIDRNTRWANNLIGLQGGLKEMAAAAEAAKGKTLELGDGAKKGGESLGAAAGQALKLQNALAEAAQEMVPVQAALMGISTTALEALMGWDTGAAQAAASTEQLQAEYDALQNAVAQATEEMIGVQAALMGISEEALRVLLGQRPEIEACAAKTLDWREAINVTVDIVDELAGALQAMGVSADSTLGRMVQGFQQLAHAAQDGAQAYAQFASGNVVGGILSGIKAVGGLVAGIKSLFGGAAKAREEMRKLSDQFVQSMGGMTALTAKAKEAGVSLDALFKAKTAEQLKKAIDSIKGSLDSWDEAQEKLNAAIEEYGFTIDELGPRMSAQKLEEQAGSLLEKYKLLTAAGVDHDAILARMGPDFGKYVDQAIAAGQSIPESMRAIVDELFAQGKLLHENGEAYTEAEKNALTYSQTVSDRFAQMAESIERLVAALERGFNVPVNFQYNHEGAPPSGNGHQPGYHGGDGYDVGGLSSGPTSGHMERLHGDEYVVPRKQTFLRQLGQEVAAAMGGGWGAGRPETIVTNVGVHVQSNQIAMAQSTAERRREGRRPRA